MSSYETSTDATDAGIDLWRVQLATGELRVMSLDALDDAFQSGLISESTPVLPPGATQWTKLADAAGLDAPQPEQNVPSVAPMAVNRFESTGDATPYASAGRYGDIVVPDLDLLADEAFKPKRGRVLAGIGVALLLAGGLGFAATRVGNVADSAQSSLSAQGASKAAAAAPPAATDLNEAAPAKTLTDEQKAKLAEADKAREAAAAAAAAKRAKDRPSSPARSGKHEKTTTPFVNGGSKYDPLNGAL